MRKQRIKKSKEDLDILTYDEIDKFRSDYITSNMKFSDDDSKYLTELDFYIECRFKDVKFETYNKWLVKSNDDEDYKFMSDILKRVGMEYLYSLSIYSDLERIGDFKFIIGIEIPDKVEEATPILDMEAKDFDQPDNN